MCCRIFNNIINILKSVKKKTSSIDDNYTWDDFDLFNTYL